MIDVSKLTERHRVVMKHQGPPREYEVGLWVTASGDLVTDAMDTLRYEDGNPGSGSVFIVRVIEPPFEPTPGMVVGDPGKDAARAVYLPTREGDGLPWLGMIVGDEVDPDHWFSTDTIRSLIENDGWKVMS